MSRRRYDVAIVGSGAGGGTLARALADTGLEILLLERGRFLPREKENWDPSAVFEKGRYVTDERWYDADGQPFEPEMHYYVGGQTKVYGAALVRLREEDFGELEHRDGVSPAWPLSYDDYEPYYTEAEWLYRVHGRRGVDPTEPPASAPYRFSPLEQEPRIQDLADDLEAAGRHPFPLPLGIDRDDDHPRRRPCIRCDTMDGFPCLVDGKCDAQVVCVEPAARRPNVTLELGTRVTELRTGASGREVTDIVAETDGRQRTFRADLVVVACGAVNSAALLLGSASDRHPDGLANSSGQVGRNLMLHNNSAMLAISTRANPTKFQKTLGLNDWYFRGEEVDYPLGHVQLLGKAKWQMLRADAPVPTPKRVLRWMAEHSVDWWITTEDLPDPENRVTLNRRGQIVLRYEANNEEPHQRLIARLEETLRRVGQCRKLLPLRAYFSKRMPLAAVCHQVGTCRFGTDPETSVLDPSCRAHDVENLYVVDGSFFPSISGVNPALTIMANSLRVADRIADRMGVSRERLGDARLASPEVT